MGLRLTRSSPDQYRIHLVRTRMGLPVFGVNLGLTPGAELRQSPDDAEF